MMTFVLAFSCSPMLLFFLLMCVFISEVCVSGYSSSFFFCFILWCVKKIYHSWERRRTVSIMTRDKLKKITKRKIQTSPFRMLAQWVISNRREKICRESHTPWKHSQEDLSREIGGSFVHTPDPILGHRRSFEAFLFGLQIRSV